tara:strand:- start:11197 stop:11670 length:474 start_codon:yes stop_codon:yes gene_type:complete
LSNSKFAERNSVKFVEEGNLLAPRFDDNGLIPVAVTDYKNNLLLMHAYMNEEALEKTLLTGEAYYWSRSRKVLWKKGNTSGMIHKVKEVLIDDDQDAIWLKVSVEGLGASCHVGYKSCFYRSVRKIEEEKINLEFIEKEKVFDPEIIYPGSDNPTKL